MKNNSSIYTAPDYTAPALKRHRHYTAFSKKDTIIRNLEVIIACVIAFIAGAGVYGLFN